MNKKNIYFGINAVIVILATIFAVYRTKVFQNVTIKTDNIIFYLFGFAVFFILLHLTKMIRIYVLLMEEKINFFRFMKVYLKITFVNFALPYKIGEAFRIYCYGHDTNNIKIGFFSVLVDRFLDIGVLLILLLPYDLLYRKDLSNVTVFLFGFIIITLLIYRIFLPTYIYLNRYLILNTNGKTGIKILKIIENAKIWYEYIVNLIEGRSAVIIMCSCLGWIFEYGALICLTSAIGVDFSISGFVEYIESIFGVGDGILLNVYTTVSCVVLAVVTFIIYIWQFIDKRVRN